jgi:uncharacterized SAM-binding protein YcdF (DUF218 family)
MGCIQTVVTIVVVTKNMCISRCWKAELVIFRICVHTPACFALPISQNLTIRWYDKSVQKVF